MGIPKTGRHALVYFIPGNPGLIDYYSSFLSFLSTILMQIDPDVVYDIYGRNLFGFHDQDHVPFGEDNSTPFLVSDQIDALYNDLCSRRIENSFDPSRIGTPYDFVIIIGHSVGSYLTLELFDRHRKHPERAPHLNLRSGILLFPTVVHIAQSPQGRKLTMLRCIPGLAETFYFWVWLLLLLIPWGVLAWVCRSFMGFSPRAAEVTADFLKSRDGVRQAIAMGLDEMDVITHDKWDRGLWEMDVEDESVPSSPLCGSPSASGSEQVPPDPTKFYFLFANEDHWVNTDIRDQWISERRAHASSRNRGSERGRTEIFVEKKGNIPHAFCTQEYASIVVAGWVRDRIRKIEATMVPPEPEFSSDHETLNYSDADEDDYSDYEYNEKIYWDDERVY